MRRVIGAGPRSVRYTARTEMASCTCAGTARASYGRHSPLKAGSSGPPANRRSGRTQSRKTCRIMSPPPAPSPVIADDKARDLRAQPVPPLWQNTVTASVLIRGPDCRRRLPAWPLPLTGGSLTPGTPCCHGDRGRKRRGEAEREPGHGCGGYRAARATVPSRGVTARLEPGRWAAGLPARSGRPGRWLGPGPVAAAWRGCWPHGS